MDKIKNAFEICLKKFDHIMRDLPAALPEYYACSSGDYIRKYETEPLDFMKTEVWQPSFFTGEALLAYEVTKDGKYLQWLEKFKSRYSDKVTIHSEHTMHDLGFLYILYSVGIYRAAGIEEYKNISLRAADELAKRYHINGEFIRAWGEAGDSGDGRCGIAIIDCMMNLSLLFWAASVTGNPFYKNIAEKHADTVLKCFVREDGSVYHAYRFDRETGNALNGENFCGFARESHWARGAAWAIYGFANCFTHTGNQKYMLAALKICHKFIDCTREAGEEEVIPPWDFRLPKDKEQAKDTSAAIITACGISELLRYTEDDQLKNYKEAVIAALLTETYFDRNEDIPGMVRESNGLHHYTLFGDYYFMELLAKEGYGYLGLW